MSRGALLAHVSRLISAGIAEARAWDIALQAQRNGAEAVRKAVRK